MIQAIHTCNIHHVGLVSLTLFSGPQSTRVEQLMSAAVLQISSPG